MPHDYFIRIRGHLDPAWAEDLWGLDLTHHPDGTTVLQGRLADQSALRGLLNQLDDLGLLLLEVNRLDASPD